MSERVNEKAELREKYNNNEMRDDEDEDLLYEVDKMLRLEVVRYKKLKVLNSEDEKRKRKMRHEDDKRMKIKIEGERKREWIMKEENDKKLRTVQALLKGIIGVGCKNEVRM